MCPTQQPKSVEGWVAAIAEEEEPLASLALNYQYLLDNYELLRERDIEAIELPKFDETLSMATIYSVLFGSTWNPAHPPYHVVYGASGIHSLHQGEGRAEAIAEQDESRWVETQDVVDIEQALDELIEDCRNTSELDDVAENFEWMRDNAGNALELQPDMLPAGAPLLRIIIVYSVVFGTLATLTKTSTECVVVDGGDVDGVYVEEENAERAAPNGAQVGSLKPSDSSGGVLSRIKQWIGRRLS